MIDILLVTYTYDRFGVLQKSFDSMFENPGMDFRLWVVENGSAFSNMYGDHSGLQQFSYLTNLYINGKIELLILNKQNLGIHHPLNQMMAIAKLQSENPLIKHPEFVMITNDDMIYEPNWLKETYETFMTLEKPENVAVVSPFHCRFLNGDLAQGMQTVKTVRHNNQDYEIKDSVSGNTWFMRGSFWLNTIDWYPVNHPTEGGDWQKLKILWDNKYKCAITPKEMVHHAEESQGVGKFNRLGHW